MALVTETNFYKYIISEFAVVLQNSSITLTPGEILGIEIEKDFDECFFPLLHIKLLLDYETYYKIVENKTTVRFKFKFGKYIVDKENQNDGSTKKYIENVFDCIFGTYIDDDVMSMDKELYEKTKASLGSQDLNRKTYDFYLFRDDNIESGKYATNCILSDCNMTDALVYLFSNAGMKNILMSPMENSKKYSEVLIPYIPLTQTVRFLEHHYGFYKSGALLFYDFTTAYFIAKYGKPVYRTNEYNKVVLTFFKPGSSNSLTQGCYKDKTSKKLIIHISQDNMIPLTESIINEQITGTNVAIVNASEDNIDDLSPKVDTRAGSTTKVILNKYENPYISKMILFNKLENSKIIDVNLFDVDITFLTPNKLYSFSFEDKATHKAYGGNYRLSGIKSIYKKQGTEFSIAIQARFKTVSFNQNL